MPPTQVVAAILHRENKVLIARKSRDALAGYWEFPGGKIQEGEQPEEALKRELREELSIEAVIGDYMTTSEYTYPHIHIELSAYWATTDAQAFALTDHDAVEWVNREDLKDYQLAPADRPFLAYL